MWHQIMLEENLMLLLLHTLGRGYQEYIGLFEAIVFQGTNLCIQLLESLSLDMGISLQYHFSCKSIL